MAYSESRNYSFVPNYAEIVVIRHGETKWNVDRRIQGQLNVDLNDIGRQQAFSVAEHISREPKVSAIYSSDLKRAFETAEIIAKNCRMLEVIKDPDLRERHLGELRGALFGEAAKVNPEAYKAFASNANDLQIPIFGSAPQIGLTGPCVFQVHPTGERVVVVSHGAAIEALYARARPSEDCRGKVLNASINVFHMFGDEDEWHIKSWGDVSHLNPTRFLESGFGEDRNFG